MSKSARVLYGICYVAYYIRKKLQEKKVLVKYAQHTTALANEQKNDQKIHILERIACNVWDKLLSGYSNQPRSVEQHHNITTTSNLCNCVTHVGQ
jgi:hypothetical protein